MSVVPYSQRTDLERVSANWNKTLGLFARGEYSLAIVRAAVTAELALNYAVRQELHIKRALPLEFVDGLLMWANGMEGKIAKLLLPITSGTPTNDHLEPITREIRRLNTERNAIAHRGEFRSSDTSKTHVASAESNIEALILLYDASFKLKAFDPLATHERSVMLPGAGMIQMPMHPSSDES